MRGVDGDEAPPVGRVVEVEVGAGGELARLGPEHLGGALVRLAVVAAADPPGLPVKTKCQ